MPHVLLIQLPIPQLVFGQKTANIPFAAACLHQAAARLPGVRMDIVPQQTASRMGDAALLELIVTLRPEIIGFTTYMWNVLRVVHLSREIKRHYTPRIIVGGPEVTPDNLLLHEPAIDFRVFGEGEALLTRLLQSPDTWFRYSARSGTRGSFSALPTPYHAAPLEPEIEHSMLLETMRGCPYTCAYCNYSKSTHRPVFKADEWVLDGLRWALARGIREVYFLDPSINARPGLKKLLGCIAELNAGRELSLISEIRADLIDMETADLLAAAGFTAFEIGLQTTNAQALERMQRSNNLNRFVQGVSALQQRGIKTTIDLIVGLPGDDPDGFAETVEFVVNHRMFEHVQVFPLAVLPGTEFHRRRDALGLRHLGKPPYTVLSTPAFTQNEIAAAFELAEERFDISLYPLPDLDAAFRSAATAIEDASDVAVKIENHTLLCKVIIVNERTRSDLERAARQVTHPYQLLIPPGTSPQRWCEALTLFSTSNPHTPFEVVFFAPVQPPNVKELLGAIRLARPHYLDGHLRWMHSEPGNRSVLFTVLTAHMKTPFAGPMQRHICWWRHPHLPDRQELAHLESQGFDGILLDTNVSNDRLYRWQDQMAAACDDLFLIDFALLPLHRRWQEKTAPESYCAHLKPEPTPNRK
jgi:hypothetical protein